MYISKTEINAIKGLSILTIVIHNVVHILTPVVENEFHFSRPAVTTFIECFCDYPITYFFSFFGWVGVSCFVFASAYGLSVKYDHKEINILQYLKRHYLKLFLLLLPAFSIYIADKLILTPPTHTATLGFLF